MMRNRIKFHASYTVLIVGIFLTAAAASTPAAAQGLRIPDSLQSLPQEKPPKITKKDREFMDKVERPFGKAQDHPGTVTGPDYGEQLPEKKLPGGMEP